jgi:hypothetical protein
VDISQIEKMQKITFLQAQLVAAKNNRDKYTLAMQDLIHQLKAIDPQTEYKDA